MALQSLRRIFIGAVATPAFLLVLCGYGVSASKANARAVQYAGVTAQVSAQPSVDSPRTIPTIPKDSGGAAPPLAIRMDNPVACYSGCVTGCNPRRETPERPCQKRCAAHCWTE